MSQVINTNVMSLNAQRNLSTSGGQLAQALATAVVRPPDQQRQGRCCWSCDLGAFYDADPRSQHGDSQFERRHFALPDGGRRHG